MSSTKLHIILARNLVLLLPFSLVVIGCINPGEGTEEDLLLFNPPGYFPETTYSFDKSPLSQSGFELGRKLFFDPLLSSDESVSCGSCHLQSVAFADSPIHPFSQGIGAQSSLRNAPPLANLAFYPHFMWDGGIVNLDFVALNAIESPIEMGESLANVVRKLNENQEYTKEFKAVYEIDSISGPFLLKALSQFMLLLISDQSPYDLYLKGQLDLSPSELRGLELFDTNCSTCHSGVLQSDFSFRHNGVQSGVLDKALGILAGQ